MINNLKILYHQGKQYIPDVTTVEVPGIFRGRPIISKSPIDSDKFASICPTGAIGKNPISIDIGRCTFCGECSIAFPDKVQFTKDYKIATNDRESLVIYEGIETTIKLNPDKIRKEIQKLFKASFKLRQISAGGDNSCELELNAAGNVNFDMGRYGIEFVASPRHADGILITGPISENMAEAVQICYDATPSPKVIILAGTDAISGGVFAESKAINRSFIDNNYIDLYIPGNPTHPLTIINGILELTRTKYLRK